MSQEDSPVSRSILTMSQVNSLSDIDFIRTFGNVFENCSLAAAAVVRRRPFSSLRHMYAEMCSFVDQLPNKGREGILRNLARIGNLPSSQNPQSRESYQEQRSVGLHDLTKEERSMLDSLNNDYYRKFGFPFVICVRLNRKEAILQKCAKRLHSTAAMELHIGVEEVKKIALLRLKNLVIEKLDSKL